MIGGKCAQAIDRFVEAEAFREIERWIEKRIVAVNASLGNRNAMQRRPRIDAQADGEIYRVTAIQTPSGKAQSFFQRLACLAWSANEKNPQSANPGFFHTLGHIVNFCGG